MSRKRRKANRWARRHPHPTLLSQERLQASQAYLNAVALSERLKAHAETGVISTPLTSCPRCGCDLEKERKRESGSVWYCWVALLVYCAFMAWVMRQSWME